MRFKLWILELITLLVARNTKGLCDECQEHRKIIIIVCIGISLIIGMIMFYFYVNQKNPVTYEDCVIQVVDKRKEATHMFFFHWMLNTGIYPNLDGFSVDKIVIKLVKKYFLPNQKPK